MQHNGNMILVGIKINDKLQEQLDASKPSVKPFFADNNEDFLQVFRIDDHEYLAKRAKSGTSLEELGNMRLNLKTMLNLICPQFVISEAAIKIYAYSPSPL
ncbi:hypothetical protein JXO52_06685 [bacterium]|nr:hypothetical protein [bacterium]